MTEPPTDARSIVPLDSGAATLALVGGKGANLARLARAGFPVPAGFLITTRAYDAFVTRHGLRGFVRDALRPPPEDPAALEAASRAIRERFEAGRMPGRLEAAVRDALAELGSPPVAVRSSATAEDLPELSFAGQHDTYLNVVGADALIAAVVRCWSSLWTARAIGYRARNGVESEGVSLAVVVQGMVQAEASGVLFTANPQSGKRSELVIEAGPGLGEGLVSGQLEPDRYVATHDGRILFTKLGSKAHSIRPAPGGGTRTVEEDAAGRPALPEEGIAELARLGARVAQLYGAPQDVEWAWDGERFSLLQSRPITSLFPLPEGLPCEPLRVMLSFGAVQGMLEPLTPLGRDALRALFAGAARRLGFDYTLETQPVLRAAAERLFVDVTPLAAHPVGRRVLQRALPLVEPGGAESLAPIWEDPRLTAAPGVSPLAGLWRGARVLLPMAVRLLHALLWPDAARARLQGRIEALVAELEARGDAARTLQERVELLEAASARGVATLIPGFPPRVAAGLIPLAALGRLASELGAGAPEILELLRGLPHNVTTEMDLALWGAACAIRGDAPSLACFGEAGAQDLAERHLAGALPDVAQRAVGAFLERYGMRGVAEIDLGRPRWREDPTAIMQVLQSYLEISDPEQAPDATFARGADVARAAIARLAEGLRATRAGWIKRRAVGWAARRVRALAGLRESPKFTIIRLFGIVRAGLLESGRELADAGVLDEPEDLFFLRLGELRDLDGRGTARDPARVPAWKDRVAERRARWQRERGRRQIPRVLLSDGQAFYEGLGSGAGDAPGLVGSPVSPGVVEGTVHVLRDPRGARLSPGEILVCPATDPGWTPLFLAAGGLVMEVGGLMTHGAVVAREYGIPAVVGVHDATHRLESGQRVRVDGSSGRIEILDGG